MRSLKGYTGHRRYSLTIDWVTALLAVPIRRPRTEGTIRCPGTELLFSARFVSAQFSSSEDEKG